MKTKISIITPVYNGEKYIETCIKSVLNTNYDLSLVEHIIVDDGSNDSTKLICEKWANLYKHIKFYSKSNGNWGSVINYVKNKKLASGDYTIVLDSDDQVTPNAFKIVDEHNGNADIVVGDFWNFNGIKKTRRVPSFLILFKKNFIKKDAKDYLFHGFIPCCTYFKTSLFYKINDLKENLVYQDNILYTQLQLISKHIKHIKKSIGLYWSVRPGNTVTSGTSQKSIDSSLSNLYFYEKENLLDLFAVHLVVDPTHLINYLVNKDISFAFMQKKLKLNCYPWWQQIQLRLYFKMKIKKLIKK